MSTLAERVLTVPEAARLLRIGVRTYYAAAKRGEVPVVAIGRRLVVPGPMLERYLAGDALAPLEPHLRALAGDDESRDRVSRLSSRPRATRSP
jgi:excisionase family DNA binding protein